MHYCQHEINIFNLNNTAILTVLYDQIKSFYISVLHLCELTSIRRVYPHLKAVDLLIHSLALPTPVDTGHKLNVHKTFRRCPGRLLNVLCTFSLCPVSTISGEVCFIFTPQWNWETSFKNCGHIYESIQWIKTYYLQSDLCDFYISLFFYDCFFIKLLLLSIWAQNHLNKSIRSAKSTKWKATWNSRAFTCYEILPTLKFRPLLRKSSLSVVFFVAL